MNLTFVKSIRKREEQWLNFSSSSYIYGEIMNYWSGVVGGIVASLIGAAIGAFLGYFGGVRLFRKQLEEDNISKVNMTVDSLMWELERHKNRLMQKPSYIKASETTEEVLTYYAYSTSSFESVIHAGWFSLLSPMTQKLLSKHYFYINQINKVIDNISIELPNSEKQDFYTKRINEFQQEAIEVINDLIKQLESERR